MDGATIPPQHTFVVRLWAEASAPNAVQWRGSVEHIASARKFYFTSLDDLVNFMTQHLGASIFVSRAEPPQFHQNLHIGDENE